MTAFMLILIPLFIFLAGVLVFALSANAKVLEPARAAIWVGLFWTIAHFVGQSVKFFSN